MYGKIKSAWKFEGDIFNYEIEIPANTTATVVLPGSNDGPVKLGSGRYSFSYPIAGGVLRE
jgi:alpha-L-rhamnosidase